MIRPSLSDSILPLLLFALLITAPRAESSIFDAITSEVQQVFDQASPAVVRVRAVGGAYPLAGTGFFIDDQGTVLTSYAVIRESEHVWVDYLDQKEPATVLGRDARSGVALLRIQRTDTPHLRFGNSDDVRMASGLISVAYPFNLPAAPSFGFVTGFDVRYLNRFFATTHIRANINVSPGQIGGPILNSRGRVLGLLVMAIQDGKECYILPVNSVARIAADIHQSGTARHGWVGVGVVEGQADPVGVRPVIVSNLFDQTPAAASGLQPGDVVLRIGDRDIRSPRDVLDASFYSRIGEQIPVQVRRDDEIKTFTFTVTERQTAAPGAGLVPDSSDNLIIPFVSPESRRNEPVRVRGE